MATTKPRVNLTLEHEHYDTLSELAKLQGTTRAGIIVDLLAEVMPTLETLVQTIKEAQKLQPEARAKLKELADRELERIQPIAEASENQFKLFTDDVIKLQKDEDGNDNA